MEVVDSARDLHMCGDMVNDSTKTASTLRVRARPDATTQKHSNAAAYTWKQIALHNTIDDAWVVIKGKVRRSVVDWDRITEGRGHRCTM